MKYIASFSGGKDSTAMVLKIIEKGLPLETLFKIVVQISITLLVFIFFGLITYLIWRT